MRKFATLAIAATAVVAVAGCAGPRSPVPGCIFTDIKDGAAVGSGVVSSKSGSATANGYLGWIATGDASITAASKAGGIKKVSYVDYHSTTILGIISTYTTTVYGE